MMPEHLLVTSSQLSGGKQEPSQRLWLLLLMLLLKTIAHLVVVVVDAVVFGYETRENSAPAGRQAKGHHWMGANQLNSTTSCLTQHCV